MATSSSTSNLSGLRGWIKSPAWLRTIRARLYLAFGVAAGMTVLASLFALYKSSDISATIGTIVSRSMPATVESLRLSEEASILVASVPSLMAVDDDSRKNQISREIITQSRMLSARLDHLRALGVSKSEEIERALAALNERLGALEEAVARRLELSAQRRALALSVRKFHEDFLEAITPLIDDANFDLMTRRPSPGDKETVNQAIESLRHLFEIQASTNLLAGLLTKSSLIDDAAKLPPIRDLIATAMRHIQTNLKALANSNQGNKIAASYEHLPALAGDDGMVALARQLDRERDARLAFAGTRRRQRNSGIRSRR